MAQPRDTLLIVPDDTWSSGDLVALHGGLIRELYEAGLGRKGLAQAITKRTNVTCTSGVMCRAMKALGIERRANNRAATRDPAEVRALIQGAQRATPLDVEDVSEVDPEDGEVPIEELIEGRVKAAKRKAIRAAVHDRTVRLEAEPFALMVFGDPHVDNEGCDWETLLRHVNLAQKTPGVMAVTVGDVQDNWIGRLQRLYSKASLRASDGWRLSKWLLEQMQWLAIVGGNHDQWAHAPGVDPLKWISKQAKVKCYANDEIRLTLTWKDAPELTPLTVVVRHDFRGNSWFHPTHGPNKEAMLDGRAHLFIAGHIHQWAQLTTEHRHERIAHAVRVRGYKRNDAHAKSLGFYEQRNGEACLIVIDPHADETGRMRIFWDLEHGCEYLTWLRSR